MKMINNEEGFILIVSLMIMTILTIIGIAATTNTSLELQIAGNDRVHKQTFYAAEAGAILSADVLEENLNCTIGFAKTDKVSGIDVADLEGTVRTYASSSNGLAFYLNDLPWTTTTCNITNPDLPDISYPITNIGSGAQETDVYLGGYTRKLPGGSLLMAAGYERKGKSAAGGGTARVYDIISRHRGVVNSESVLIFGWQHLIGEEFTCKYD